MNDNTIRIIDILTSSFIPMLKAGLLYTIPLSLITFVLGTLLGLFVALIRIYKIKVLSTIVYIYVWIIRGTPLLVQLFIIFYGLPSAGITINAYYSAIIGFTLNVGAYSSEIIRASIQSVPKGQWEASLAIGFNNAQRLIYIILPQAFKVALPTLSNSFISLVKDTSLAAAITFTEMFRIAQQITARTYEPLWLYTEAAFIYLLFCTVLTILQSRLEKKYEMTGAH